MKKILLCLPFAGGSSTWYIKWSKYLDDSIFIETIELSGRGKRLWKPFYTTLMEAVDDIFLNIPEKIYENQYFLFGHSMGCTLVYELVYKIIKSGYPPPVHIFFSGRLSPEQCFNMKRVHDLPIMEFKEEILKLGGTSSEVFDEKELQKLFVPIMRADYKILEEHDYKKYKNLLPCDISILYGEKDEHTPEDKIYSWRSYTEKKCDFYSFPAGHFFIKDCEEDVVKIINKTIITYNL
ncbi:Surfactin synthase thioesterase subunit [Clostridium cavendishii DSM 21758]|uniref:Surfactin synthase thioesterase subunit n=1 Tax=Clostridium cavendishii DSM 21758 TaxID=1121302 RepID=A0A1M6MS92_9CLOT|nr:thioesterase domain-containing protein [Clostridium cavendishii]SHJ86314.1 Surfactin synthase thioesterase subunit [Clostridium cavendishii DSM 21758]